MSSSTQTNINQAISSSATTTAVGNGALSSSSSASSSIIKSLSDEKSKSKQMEKENNLSAASSSTSETKDSSSVIKGFVSHSWKLKENVSFEEEYKSISKSLTKAKLHENEKRVFYVDEENEFKNRYSNVLCYSDTRVVLKPLSNAAEDDEEEFLTAEQDKMGYDYINASFIRGASGNVEYICSQAPVDDTIVDFWRMIWQEDIQIVLMLTPLVEGGRRKSSAYFPDKAKTTLTFVQENTQLSVKVTCEDCDVIIEGLTHRKMNIDLVQGERRLGSKTISHIHFTEWPDFGVGDEEKLVSLIDFVDSSKTTTKPMIVHCSAGIGRSGTYCAIDITKNIITRAKSSSASKKQEGEESKIDVPSIVSSLRNQRPGMVQTAGQYELIYKIVLKWMEKKGYM